MTIGVAIEARQPAFAQDKKQNETTEKQQGTKEEKKKTKDWIKIWYEHWQTAVTKATDAVCNNNRTLALFWATMHLT